MIDSEQMMVIKQIRNNDNSWQLTEYTNIEETFELNSVQIKIQLSEIYDGVKFK